MSNIPSFQTVVGNESQTAQMGGGGGERPITYGNGEKGLRRQYWSNDTAIPPGIGRIAVVPHSSSSSIVIESQGAEDNVRRIGAYRYKAKWEEPGWPESFASHSG
jgi:hypothetical protein